MTDIFLSYSRKDKDFVRKLYDALVAKNREVWVDWEDIPFASDWRAEIFAGIDSANNFLFVISPDSAASPVCNEELQHGIANKKRLVPILFRETPPESLNTAISSHNWIYFRESDDFDKAIEALIQTLDTDLDYVRMHTRLLVRAREWNNKAKNSSFCLRGEDLRDAEQWLANSSGKQPAPSPLHLAFIAASRQAAIARQRVTVALLSVGFVISLLLAFFAITQWGVATYQEGRANSFYATAQNNYQTSERLRLAAVANTVINSNGGNGELAALIGIQAAHKAYSAQADAALDKAISVLYVQQAFIGHSAPIYRAVFSPDGTQVVTAGGDQTIRLWDRVTGKEMREFTDSAANVRTDAPKAILALAFSPDGATLVSAGEDYLVRQWDTHSGKLLHVFSGHTGIVDSVAFSPDGTALLTSGADQTARLWDLVTGQELSRVTVQSGEVLIAVFSPDGKTLLLGSKNGIAYLWDVANNQEIRRVTVSGNVRGAAFSPDGKTFITGGSGRLIVQWNSTTGQQIRQFVGHTDNITDLKFSPDGRYLISASVDKTARVWEVSSGYEVRQFAGHTDWVNSAVFSPDGKFVLTGSQDNTARLWRADLSYQPGQFVGDIDSVLSAQFSPDGKQIVTGGRDNTVRVWDAETNEQLFAYTGYTSSVYSVQFSSDGRQILTASSDGTVRLIDTSTGTELKRFQPTAMSAASGPNTPIAPIQPLYSAAFSPDGRYVLAGGDDNSAHLWDLTTGQELRQFHGKDSVWSVGFSPDSKTILIGSLDGTVALWDTQSGQLQRQINADHAAGPAVYSAMFAPDGKTFLTAGQDKLLRLWDAVSGVLLREFSGHSGPIYAATFSPDGRYIVTASGDKTARLWDIGLGQEVREYIGHTANVVSVSFSHDGKYILTGSKDKTARRWLLSDADLLDYACQHIFRDFTADERAQFIITDNAPTCGKFAKPAATTPTTTDPVP